MSDYCKKHAIISRGIVMDECPVCVREERDDYRIAMDALRSSFEESAEEADRLREKLGEIKGLVGDCDSCAWADNIRKVVGS